MDQQEKRLVVVIGAGPAGLFATRELANQGIHVVLLNRDIKPGGLAEYGIYPDKYKMKEGLRAQFRSIIEVPNVEYYGNVTVGEGGDLTLNDLREMGAQALLITAGAQGTKWLGISGENLTGVYHAKDLVYHYNLLPPFSTRPFCIGRRVVLVGAGNVMVDIAHYLISEKKVEDVLAVVRRGPAEVKFERKELEYVVANLDTAALDSEIERVSPVMRSIGQNPDEPRAFILSVLPKALPTGSDTCFHLRFLSSPVAILGDDQGRVTGLEIENNILQVTPDGEVKARSLGTTEILPADTVIFAIGDRVDERIGLPVSGGTYKIDSSPRYPQEGMSYEVCEPGEDKCRFEGIFVAGWARKASTGLVGVARKDGTNGAHAVLQYLQTLPPLDDLPLETFRDRLHSLCHPVVTRDDLNLLLAAEQMRARELGLPAFKFSTNDEMLRAIGLMDPRIE